MESVQGAKFASRRIVRGSNAFYPTWDYIRHYA